MSLTCNLYELSMSQIIWGLTCKPNACNLSNTGNSQLFGREKRQIIRSIESQVFSNYCCS